MKDQPTYDDLFRESVKQMRDAQRRYFRTRDYAALQESKSLEGLVDAMLDKMDMEEQK